MTLDLDALVLRSGTHASPADGVSLMEAVSVVAGEPWSNRPSCTSPVIAAYARSLNDWLPDNARQRLKAYIPRLVGTAEPDRELLRAFACADAAVRVFAQLACTAVGLVEEAAVLGRLAPVDRESAESARLAAESAETAARSAASLSDWSAAESTRSAADAARSAAQSAQSASTAARSTGWSAADSAQAAGRTAARSAWSAHATGHAAARPAAESAAESKAFELLDRLIAAASRPTAEGSMGPGASEQLLA
jgi:hypothetical protein